MILLYSILVFTGVLMALTVGLIVAERRLVNYGVCRVDINAGEKPLDVEGGQTLLASLYGNEVFIPSACGGQGTCGHCKIKVLAGGGPVLPTEKPFLSRREIRTNVRLACQVKVREDMEVQIPEELLNVKLFSATVVSTRALTHDIKEIRFALDDPAEITQRAGQYVQIEAPSADGPVYRAYSISSPEYDTGEVELNVRLIEGGIGSTYLHNLETDDPVRFTGPYGEWKMAEGDDVELVCVGGGVGMAPMKDIVFSFFRRWPQRTCWLFFGCRTTKDIFYLKDFQALAAEHPGFHVIYALSDELGPEESWDGETGFIHLSVDKYLTGHLKRQAFLCGPPPMIDAVTKVLHDKGLREDDIFWDKFD